MTEAKIAIASPYSGKVSTVPYEVVLSILKTSAGIVALDKELENRFGKYKYVSIDIYYDKIASVAIANGLTWVVRETGFVLNRDEGKKEKPQDYICATYDIDLYHKDGHVLQAFDTVTIIHPVQGAQTSGSARSYADKLFMRGLFKVVTGELDADQTDGTFMSRTPVKTPAPASPAVIKPPGRKPDVKALIIEQPIEKPFDPAFSGTGTVKEAPKPEPDIPDVDIDIEDIVDELDPEKTVVDSFKVFQGGAKYPVMARPSPEGAQKHSWDIVVKVFEIFAPTARDIDELTAFWMDNKVVLKMLEQVDNVGYEKVVAIMSARKKSLL